MVERTVASKVDNSVDNLVLLMAEMLVAMMVVYSDVPMAAWKVV